MRVMVRLFLISSIYIPRRKSLRGVRPVLYPVCRYARDGTPVFDFLYLYPAQEVTPRRPARFISRLSVYGFCFD
nr:MAG TPA: hypothetical protein [Caudoviricetes sp.]